MVNINPDLVFQLNKQEAIVEDPGSCKCSFFYNRFWKMMLKYMG
jgi:hypothetical protein